MATPNYEIDYKDERFQQVEAGKQDALTQMNNTYDGMVNQTDKYYQDQIDAAKDWANTQQQLQQEQTDFTVEQIGQQKDQAKKDYTKEQSGAYVDWQKQSGAYGANAEQMAAQGLQNTGYSESSQVSMYNTYQNRVAMARETFAKAVLNYDNAIKDAQLQNNAKLAEIAYQALQTQLELSLEGFQYKNQLLVEQQKQQREIDSEYHNRYLAVLNQMNTENALAEEVRQYNESLALQREQLAEEIRQYEQSYALQLKQYNEQVRQFDAEMSRLKAQDKKENEYKIKQLELQKKSLQQEQKQWEKEYKLKEKQLKEQQRQFDKSYAASQKKSSGSSGSSGSSSVKKSSGSSGSSKTTKATTSKAITKASQMSKYAQGLMNSVAGMMIRGATDRQRQQAAVKVAQDAKMTKEEREFILKSIGVKV
jgi:hypothetical protein